VTDSAAIPDVLENAALHPTENGTLSSNDFAFDPLGTNKTEKTKQVSATGKDKISVTKRQS
jgi:hypothetical protein